MKDSRVYILGAGCSYDQNTGYPLASGFIQSLTAFATKISADPQKQRTLKAVQDTIDLLTRCQSGAFYASTVDQMINLVLKHQCDGDLAAIANVNNPSTSQIDHLRMEAVRKAKVATAACFLDMEQGVRNRLIPRYRNFIEHKIFHNSGQSESTLSRLRKSDARVLTFNYDRMFELAFFATAADSFLQNYYAYGTEVLNSGLEVTGEIAGVAADRFCFIKLHGSIGFLCNEDAFGQRVYQIIDAAKWSPIPILDAHFFSDQPTRHAFRDPMIVFPFEKDFVRKNPGNKFDFRAYINTAWDHAAKVIQEATEIWVIGYSFDPTDCKYLIDLLREARNCGSLVIQNPNECDHIEQLLIHDGIKIPLKKNPSPF